MNFLSPHAKAAVLADADSLETLLDVMQKYGRPRVAMLDGGWCCIVDMRVASVGTEFKIASEFGHPSPRAAAEQCAQRMQQTLRDLARTTA